MNRLLSTLLVGGLAPTLGACPSREVSELEPDQAKEERKSIPITVNRDIDILFVIDNSISMLEEQASLQANFPRFINVLNSIQGGLPNVHLGVVSSDMGTLGANAGIGGCEGFGDNGALQNNGCSQVTGNFIRSIDTDGDGTHDSLNFTGALTDAFSCMASLGNQGCGLEQHLESMKRALTPGNAVNNGFLRPNALLAVVFVADEDDCSANGTNLYAPDSAELGFLDSFRCFEYGVQCDQDSDDERAVGPRTGCAADEDSAYLNAVQSYVDFLKGLKADPKDVVVAGIIGNVEPVAVTRRTPSNSTVARPDLAPSCQYNGPDGPQTADPGIRLKHFLDQFPDRSTFTTICNENLSDALDQIAGMVIDVLGNPCIEENLLDANPDVAGVQPECVVSYITDPDGAAIETPLPRCDAKAPGTPSVQPCWRLTYDPEQCPIDQSPSQLALEVVRTSDPPADTYIDGRCATE